MVKMYKKPLRTYERNPKPRPIAGGTYTSLWMPSKLERDSNNTQSDFFSASNESLDSSRFESTFDKIRKTAKLPPLELSARDNMDYSSSFYASSSDDETLELVPCESPIYMHEVTNYKKKEKKSTVNVKNKQIRAAASTNVVEKKLEKKSIEVRKRNTKERNNASDNERDEDVEFPPLRKTRRAGHVKPVNSDHSTGTRTDRFTDISDSANKSIELKDCSVKIARMNLSNIIIDNVQSLSVSSSSLPVTVEDFDAHKNQDTSNDEIKMVDKAKHQTELVNDKICRVILSRLDKQSMKQKEIDKNQSKVTKRHQKLWSSVVCSTPVEKQMGQLQSKLTLSPINHNIDHLTDSPSQTVLIHQTKQSINSDERSDVKDTMKLIGRKLSTIGPTSIETRKKSEKIGKLEVENINPDVSDTLFLPSLHRNSTILISDDTNSFITNTYDNISRHKMTDLPLNRISEQVKDLQELKVDNVKEIVNKKNLSHLSTILLFDDIDNSDERDKSLQNNEFSDNKKSSSDINSSKNSCSVNETTNSKIISQTDEITEDDSEVVNSSSEIPVQHNNDGKRHLNNSTTSLSSTSENDEESIHLVLSTSSSDNENKQINSMHIISDIKLRSVNDNNDHQAKSCGNNSGKLNNNDKKNTYENISNNLEQKNELPDSFIQQPLILLTRLNDKIRINNQRGTFKSWVRPLNMIPKSSEECHSDENSHRNVLDNVQNEEKTTIFRKKISADKSLIFSPGSDRNTCESINTSLKQRYDSNIFLKPGKSWARSLSILNNIHNKQDIQHFSVGKGKKWRQSVNNVLSMQRPGSASSCIQNMINNESAAHEDIDFIKPKNLLSTIHDVAELSISGRFIRRISVRVIPNADKNNDNKYVNDKINHDSSFLEVFGINSITSNKQSSTCAKTSLSRSQKQKSYNLRISNVPEEINQRSPVSFRTVVLERCQQKDYLSFEECYPDSYLEYCKKIGEGVYGEVYLYDYQKERTVVKIIPIEGDQLVNGEPQKKFNEILSEIIIAKELHNLRFQNIYNTTGFVQVKNIRCIIGKYPKKLSELWNKYDDEENSENDNPIMFKDHQIYITLELSDGGEDMESFSFQNAFESYITFLQIALTLAIAEKGLEFEHRDLHWGNVLISRTTDKQMVYKLGNEEITLACSGLKVTLIDFTLSRMSYEGCCIYNDLALDPALFNATGEYQFEIYRLMRTKLNNNWQLFEPYTNILWLHYILDKMIKDVHYNKKILRIHKSHIKKLQELKDCVLDYDSAFDFVSNCNKLTNLQKKSTGN